jgi:hypothetical protein
LSIWKDHAELFLSGDLDSLFQFGFHFKPPRSLPPKFFNHQHNKKKHKRQRCENDTKNAQPPTNSDDKWMVNYIPHNHAAQTGQHKCPCQD